MRADISRMKTCFKVSVCNAKTQGGQLSLDSQQS